MPVVLFFKNKKNTKMPMYMIETILALIAQESNNKSSEIYSNTIFIPSL